MPKDLASLLSKHVSSAAVGLLGCTLMHTVDAEVLAGIIVETEAYHPGDEASHSFGGQTQRNSAMFGGAAVAYVYRSYGLHWCFNVSCGPQGFGAAVLIRALRPTCGIDTQRRLRGLVDDPQKPSNLQRLCQGPGNLTRALGISSANNHTLLLDPNSALRLKPAGADAPSLSDIRMSPRIGISRNVPALWRFFVANERCVSATRKGTAIIGATGQLN